MFSKVESLLIGRDKINYLTYLFNQGIISGAELDAILVFAQNLAKEQDESDYLSKAINLVQEDKIRAEFVAGDLTSTQDLPN